MMNADEDLVPVNPYKEPVDPYKEFPNVANTPRLWDSPSIQFSLYFRLDDSVTIHHNDIDVKAMTVGFDFKATPQDR